jgi:hypothetical protein
MEGVSCGSGLCFPVSTSFRVRFELDFVTLMMVMGGALAGEMEVESELRVFCIPSCVSFCCAWLLSPIVSL